MPWQYTSPPSTIAASSDKDALPCVPPNLDLSECGPACPNQCLPDCCFLDCRTLSNVIEILGSTFACCSQLQQLSLPRNLQIIEQEAFLKCTSLEEVCIPPSLLYIARRAFAGCTQLRAVRKKGKAKHGEVQMSGSMHSTNVSNWASTSSSDS